MNNIPTKTDILIEKLKQSKKEALEEISNDFKKPEFQEALKKLRELNKKRNARFYSNFTLILVLLHFH